MGRRSCSPRAQARPFPAPRRSTPSPSCSCERATHRTPAWHPAAVEFAFPRPPDASEHTRIFGVPPRFEARDAALVVPGEVWSRTTRARDPGLFAVLDDHARALLSRAPSAEDDLVERVRAAVATELTGRAPSLPSVARRLGTSARSLQRRLESERTSFAQVVDHVRRERAEAALHDPGRGDRRGELAPRLLRPERLRARVPALDGAVTRAVAPRADGRTGLTPPPMRPRGAWSERVHVRDLHAATATSRHTGGGSPHVAFAISRSTMRECRQTTFAPRASLARAGRTARRGGPMSLTMLAIVVVVILALGYTLYGRFIARQYALDDAPRRPPCRLERRRRLRPDAAASTCSASTSARSRPRARSSGRSSPASSSAGCPACSGSRSAWSSSAPSTTSRRSSRSVRHRARSIAEIVRENLGRRAWLAMMRVHLDRARLRDRRVRRRHREHVRRPQTRSSTGQRSRSTRAARSRPRRTLYLAPRGRDGARPALVEAAALARDGDLRAGDARRRSGSARSARTCSRPATRRRPGASSSSAYCFVASLLPVWVLLQPRGYLGGFVLYLALARRRRRRLLRRLRDQAARVQRLRRRRARPARCSRSSS